jgi:G protein-coupled receptor Mth (Methuselah protein)
MSYYYHYLLLIFFLFKFCLTIDNNDQCLIRDSCQNSSLISPSIYEDEIFIKSRNCFCDSICEEYGDCCYNSTVPSKNYECVDFLLPTIDDKTMPFPRLSVWMRNECLPIYSSSSVDKLCRNVNNQMFNDTPILFIPVTSLETNITYTNYYCAYCNNDANINIQFWEYKSFCYGKGNDTDFLFLNNNEDVQYYVYNLTRNCSKTIVYPHNRGSQQPTVFIRPCKKSLPTNCPLDTPIDLARKCSSSRTAYRYVPYSDIIYRNSHCAECNSMNSSEVTCLDPYVRSPSLPMTQMRIPPLSILFDPNLLQRYINDDVIPSIIYSINYNCSKTNELYDLFLKKCSQITNSSKEFILSMKCSNPIQTFIQINDTIYNENGTLYLRNYSILLTRDEYIFISHNRIVFCVDRWINRNSSSIIPYSIPFYRNILSVICTSISLVCLLLFGTVFCLISSLHNLPGKCLLFLSISLFLGQLTFISTSDSTEHFSLCFASGIIIHYFYLSSFFWLLIISIHIHSTFNHQTINQDKIDKNHHRLIVYNIFVWSSAGLIILIAVLIQVLHPQSNFSPAYGSIFCSISKANAMIIFFLVPIGCILLIVAILFIKTLWAIHRSHSATKLARGTSSSTSNRNNLATIYARLASLMGIQWILLIGALAIRQTWLWIIFEIVNSLPGLFICLGFLCSKKLLNNLKEKITMQIMARRQSLRSNTTSSTAMSPSIPIMNTTKKFHF